MTVLVSFILRLNRARFVKMMFIIRSQQISRLLLLWLMSCLAESTDFGLETEIFTGYSRIGWKKTGLRMEEAHEPAVLPNDLTIAPSWTDYEASVGEKLIVCTPGMAFGTRNT